MSTVFQSLTAAIVASLERSPALADGRVWANRLRPIPENKATAVVVRLEQSDAVENVIGMLDWQTRFAVECYGRGVVGADPAGGVDDLMASVWARLAAFPVSDLGAMALTVNPSIDWQYDDADTPMACAVIRVSVTHRTAMTGLAPLL
jgi:hypothetical protein